MKKLNLPAYEFKIRKEGNKLFIFDCLRKKEIILTPEEWVRQNLIQFLVNEKRFPMGLISIESGLKINRLQKRYDALVYSRKGNALVLIECKAPEVSITNKVFEQILIYNSKVKAKYLLISNGFVHYFLKRGDTGEFVFENQIPGFEEINPDNQGV